MKKDIKSVEKEQIPIVDHESLELPHEKLLRLISEIDPLTINRTQSFDRLERPLTVYGQTHEKAMTTLREILVTISKDLTLTRKTLIENRFPLNEGLFFIGADGYFIDKRYAIMEYLQIAELLANRVNQLHASLDKTKLIKHNLKLANIIINDMLEFVSNLRYGSK